jgi:tripeptidyl-peptidase-1
MLDLDIAYSIIYPQTINYIPVDDMYYQTNYYYKGFGDTLLDALDGSFCTYSAFGQKGNNNSVDPVYPDVHAPEPEGYKGPLQCGIYTPPKVISFSYGPG